MCSPEHHLFKADFLGGIKEIAAGKIRRTMFLAGIRELQPCDQEILNPDLWRFIGYFLGDGWMRNREVSLYDKNESTLKFYQTLLHRIGIASQLSKYSDRNSFKLSLSNKYMESFMRQIGLSTTSKLKRVPKEAFQSSKQHIAQLVAGFYDAEGNEGKMYRFFNTNVRLLQDIQILLLYLGINSSLYERWRMVTLPQGKRLHNKIYALGIFAQEDMNKFRCNIPTLKKLPEPKVKGLTKEYIPIGHYLRSLMRVRRKAGIKVWGAYPKSLARYVNENHQPTRRNLLNWRPFVDTPIIRKMLSFTWLKVTAIHKVNYKTPLIDIGVIPTNAFIADGFISHNSRAVDLLRKKMSPAFVQQFLRHSSFNTTAIYLEITGDELGSELEKVEANGKGIL